MRAYCKLLTAGSTLTPLKDVDVCFWVYPCPGLQEAFVTTRRQIDFPLPAYLDLVLVLVLHWKQNW